MPQISSLTYCIHCCPLFLLNDRQHLLKTNTQWNIAEDTLKLVVTSVLIPGYYKLTTTSSRILVGHGLEWNLKCSSSCCFLFSRSWILFSISNSKPIGCVSSFTGGFLGRIGPPSKILWSSSRALNLYLHRDDKQSPTHCMQLLANGFSWHKSAALGLCHTHALLCVQL